MRSFEPVRKQCHSSKGLLAAKRPKRSPPLYTRLIASHPATAGKHWLEGNAWAWVFAYYESLGRSVSSTRQHEHNRIIHQASGHDRAGHDGDPAVWDRRLSHAARQRSADY